MAENEEKSAEEKSEDRLDGFVGLSVVVLATFLGVCNVKDGNIVQAMDREKAAEINNWGWFQARNIREGVYAATADHLSIPLPNESAEAAEARTKLAKAYRD